MEVKLNLSDFDKKINDLVEKKIINPIKEEFIQSIRPEILSKSLRNILTKEAKKNVEDATRNFLDDWRVKNEFGFDLDDKIRETIGEGLSEFKEKIGEATSSISSNLNNLDEILDNYKVKVKEKNLDLVKFYNGLMEVKNLSFEFIQTEDNIDNVEVWVLDKFLKEDVFLIGQKYGDLGYNCNSVFNQILKEKNGELFDKLFRDKIPGCPDLIFKDKDLIYFVEVKKNGDGIRGNQIKWAKDHPDYLVRFVFVNSNGVKEDNEEIKQEGEKNGPS